MSNPAFTDLRQNAVAVVRRLQEAGYIAYWAGGCVRDMLRNQAPKDYDIATSALPERVMELFPGAVATGKAFGVVRVRVGCGEFEVATFRQDAEYRDGRHPAAVAFTDPETDAQRRDFTINALFYDPVAGRLHDFVEGEKDLRAGVVRAVGDAGHRFREDHLRLLRAVRFAAVLQFALEPATAAALRRHAALLSKVSAERIRDELTRILLEAPQAGAALRRLDDLGLLQVILPEVAAMKGQAQPPAFHPEGDVLTHTALMLDGMVQPSLRLAYAVLLHDVGKPPTAQVAEDRIRFDGHAGHGAALARKILERLRFSGDDIEAICHCVGNHMRFMDVQRMRVAKVRRLVGAPTFPIELELHRLDCLASHQDLEHYRFLVAFQERLRDEPALPPPWVTGRDIMALGVPQGPQVGEWHKRAYEAQLEGAYGDRPALLAWLREEITRSKA